MKFYVIVFILLSVFSFNTYAADCEEIYSKVEDKTRDFFRIQEHIKEHPSTCNVVYAYSLFLDNPIEMEALESDNTYAEQLGKFVKKYRYTSKFIFDQKTFEFFNRYYDDTKKTINEAIRVVFQKKDYHITKNLQYILLALDISGDYVEKDKFIQLLRNLRNQYSLEEIDAITIFWSSYKKKYKIRSFEAIYEFENFEKIVDEYSVQVLQKYLNYSLEFFPVLLSSNKDNMIYIYTIKSLLRKVRRQDTTLTQQAYFLKNISIDIEVALAKGKTSKEIVSYFKKFIDHRFVLDARKLSCMEKEGISMLVSDNLNSKLNWKKESPIFFSKLMGMLDQERDIVKVTNMLALYNYAASTYRQMKTENQKKMFMGVVNLPTNNMLFNLSLLYALGEETSYFSSIVNNPESMYEGEKGHEKYKEIFYVRRNGNSILSLFKKGDKYLTEFKNQVNDLVNTSNDEIHNLTANEKLEIALTFADYASYATMIIPGVGIAAQIGKAIGKNGVKVAVNIAYKEAKSAAISSLKHSKEKIRKAWEKRTYHFKPDNLSEDEIVRLSKLSDTYKGTKQIRKEIGQLNLTPKAQEDAYLRIAIHQNKIKATEAQIMFKNLSGSDGFQSTLSKIIGNSDNVTKGHLNELRIANHAAEEGFDVIAIGKKFNDGMKVADTDIDILLRINGKDVLIEAKDYASTTKFPLDSYRRDLNTLNIYEKKESAADAFKVFSFTEKPKSEILLKQYELWAKKKGVRLIFGTPEEQIMQIAYYTKSSKFISRLDATLMGTLVGYQIYKYWDISEQKNLCKER